jgi:hypothetical protein
VSELLLRVEQCITYLHRIEFQSCYAVTLHHHNLYERERPASESIMILAGAGFEARRSQFDAWNIFARADESETNSISRGHGMQLIRPRLDLDQQRQVIQVNQAGCIHHASLMKTLQPLFYLL